MRALRVEVLDELVDDVPYMLLAEEDHPVQAPPARCFTRTTRLLLIARMEVMGTTDVLLRPPAAGHCVATIPIELTGQFSVPSSG